MHAPYIRQLAMGFALGSLLFAAFGKEKPAPIAVCELLPTSDMDRCTDCVFSRDGKDVYIAVGSGQKHSVYRYTIADKKSRALYENITTEINDLAISSNGRWLAVACDDGKIKLFDTANMATHELISGRDAFVLSLCFSADSERLIASDHSGKIDVWSIKGKKIIDTREQNKGAVWKAVCLPDNKTIVYLVAENIIERYDYSKKATQVLAKLGKTHVFDIAIDKSGTRLAVASSKLPLSIFAVETGERLRIIDTKAGTARKVAFTADENYLLIGCGDPDYPVGATAYIEIWDAKKWKYVTHFAVHDSMVTAMDISFDAKFIVSGARLGNVRLWKLDDALRNK